MTALPPPWIAPGVRLIEAGAVRGWADIAQRADAFEAEIRKGGPAVVHGDGVPTTVAALVAAERAGVELVLKRHAGSVAENATPVAVGGAAPGGCAGACAAPPTRTRVGC